jgi:hypothetical protein
MKMSIIIFLLSLSYLLCIEPRSISLTFDEELGFYTVPVSFGSKEEVFNVQVDTTTSETWIPSYKTTLKVKKYNITQSTKGQKTNKTFEVEDEDGDVRGKACYDSVKVGDVMLDHFGFVLVDEFEFEFKDFAQGKLGLGYKQEHGIDFNFIGKLKEKKLIEKEVFSINADTKELVIGEIPTSFKNQLYTTCSVAETNDLDDEYRQAWSCELTHIIFNLDKKQKNKDLDYAFEANARVTFDSAYPYISIPKRHLKAFKQNFMNTYFNNSYKEVKEDDATYFICTDESLVKHASISFIMEGYAYIIPSEKLFIQNDKGEYEMLIRFYKENDNIFSFGNPFVNFFTLVYDYEEKEVGFLGGDRVEMTKEWYDYMNEMTPQQLKAKRQKTYIFGGVAFFLVVIVILLCYRNKREDRMNRRRIQMENDAF